MNSVLMYSISDICSSNIMCISKHWGCVLICRHSTCFCNKTGTCLHPLGYAESQIKSLHWIPFSSLQQQPQISSSFLHPKNGCWSSNKQQCKINEGKRVVISISIKDSVSSLTWGAGERDRRERRRRKIDAFVIMSILKLLFNEVHFKLRAG